MANFSDGDLAKRQDPNLYQDWCGNDRISFYVHNIVKKIVIR